ncbi:MAG: hypothetical protein ACXVLQ_18105 [Bacteriovorax sp.]
MRKIECVREENDGPLDSYLKKLINDLLCEIKFCDWKKTPVKTDSPLILVADSAHLADLKTRLSSREEKVIIAFNSRKEFKLVTELKSEFDKIFGFIDLSQEIEYNVPVLKNYLNLNFSKHTVKLDKLAGDLDKIYEFTKNELTRIKDLHDRFVKMRVDSLKGASLTSKFMAGEKSGGEFFEIIQNDQDIFFIQTGCDSYLLSSMIMAEIETLKEKSTGTNLKLMVEQFQKIITHHADENKAELSYCIMNLNLKTLQAHFSLKGSGHIFYLGELISFTEPLKLNLRPRDRLCLISQGAMKNWEIYSKQKVNSFFNANQSKKTRDLIDEFFFEISRTKEGHFLIYDALMAVVEIEENVLYQLS